MLSRKRFSRVSVTFFSSLLLLILFLCVISSLRSYTVSALPLFSKKSTNPYEVLGVQRSATHADIKKAFRRLTMEHHPDLKEKFEEKEEAKKKMISILAAYEILSDEQRRDEFDRTGMMFGTRAPSPEDFTTLEQLFQFYNMHAPIVSKTRTLESLLTLQQLLDYRGPKVILIQIFADSMEVSRKFSSSWEAVTRSPLVEAGLLEMYRIDVFSSRGAPLAAKLGIRVTASSKTLPLIAIVDGERWPYNSNKPKGEVPVEEEILEFVHSFFYEITEKMERNSAYSVEEIREHLMSRMSVSHPVRLLMFPTASDGLLTAVYLRYPQVELIPTTRAALLKFMEVDCGRPITIEDRFGGVVSAPDFIVALTAPISNLTASEESATEGDQVSKSELLSSSDDHCSAVEVGASFFLTFGKVSKFLDGILPPAHPEMGSIPLLDNINFMRVCHGDCLLYVRPRCPSTSIPAVAYKEEEREDAATTTLAVELLRRPYHGIETGYLCINDHPRLEEALVRSLPLHHPLAREIRSSEGGEEIEEYTSMEKGRKMRLSDPFFALLLHGDDRRIFPILPSLLSSTSGTTHGSSITKMTPSMIDEAIGQILLAELLQDEENDNRTAAATFSSSADSEVLQEINLVSLDGISVGVGKLLETSGFPMSPNQRYSILSTRLLKRLRPLASGLFPFFAMFMFHKYFLNRKSTVKPVNRTGKKMGAIFDDDDLDNALEGHGFLILVVDKRPAGSGPLTLPSIASDSRFVVRVLGQEHVKWKRWIEREKAKRFKPPENPPEDGMEDTGISDGSASDAKDFIKIHRNLHTDMNILAIRQGRMTGAIKADTQSVETFLHDLLDATIPSNIPVPYKVLM